MDKWKEIHIEGITSIERCIAEFEVWELEKSPYAKFRVKVYEDRNRKYKGYTNLRELKERKEDFSSVMGYGMTIEECLRDTINEMLKMLSGKEDCQEDDFKYLTINEF